MAISVLNQNVGIDISKHDFKVCFYQLLNDQRKRIKASRTFNNTLKGFTEFLNWVNAKRGQTVGVRITLEATGVYYEQLVHYLHDHTDFHISVVLPNVSKAYFKSLNLKSKTDRIDAKALGMMGLERDLNRWQPFSNNLLLIKQLTRERLRVLEEKTANMNRLEALRHSYQPNGATIKRLNVHLKLLSQQIKAIEKDIIAQIKVDPELEQRIDKVCTIKGIGLITAATIVAETGGFKLFSSQGQLICYSGYDVVERQSGSSIKGKTRISKRGNKYIRRALHFPAIVTVKYDERMTQLFNRVRDRTGINMKAYVAVQRKLLILIYTLFTKNEKYDPNYLNQQSQIEVSKSL
jgi:transposase